MQSIFSSLENIFKQAFIKTGLKDNIILTESSFSDYQINGIMPYAKELKANPRILAQQVINNLELDYNSIINKLEIAGPGFINITLDNNFLANYLFTINEQNHYSCKQKIQNVVVDLSGPNLAKEMHVGHLRSTVIGDAIANLFEYIGYNVIRQNHVGDWGTQFGMLIAYLEQTNLDSNYDIKDLEEFYRQAKIKFDTQEDFAHLARSYVNILQNWQQHGDTGKRVYNYWQNFREISLKHCQAIYNKLNIKLDNSNVQGESFYNEMLPGVVNSLDEKGLLKLSDGAKCVFLENITTPFLVQKQDGSFLYATTDLAALTYRIDTLKAQDIIYIVDARQSLHFKQLFLVAQNSGIVSKQKLTHAAFGTMMNEGGKPFKTRTGGTVKLIDLIEEAQKRALNNVTLRNPTWQLDERQKLANVMAIAAIKYADLAKNRLSDYIFSFDKMLSFEGNTAPYLLYAYTRIQSLLQKIVINTKDVIIFTHITERSLGLHLAKFNHILITSARDLYPHYLCQYLYNLAGIFMQFYENCPIAKVEDLQLQISRVNLAKLTASILKTGLNILGIETINKM